MKDSRFVRSSVVAFAALALVGIGTVAPASAASCPLQKQADGTTYPVICPNGKFNAKAAPQLAKAMPELMALHRNATFTQVKDAVCTSMNELKATNPMIESALVYQTARWGWAKKYAAWFTDGVTQGNSKNFC